MNEIIEKLVVQLSTAPFDPELNFKCAVEYQRLNQTASAVSFYLRAAEFGYESHKDITYCSLLKIAECFSDQNDRQWNVTNYILHAVSYMPERPEAYFLMSQYLEQTATWQEAYTWAQMGLSKQSFNPLPAQTGYLGEYCLLFEKAISGWWIGRREESINILETLLDKYEMREDYVNGCIYNLERIKGV